MPASRAIALADRLSSRSNTGRAVAPAAGTLIITSYVLPAAMKTSLCTRETPGSGLPSSAIRLNRGTAGVDHANGGPRIAATARLPGPYIGLEKARSVDCGIDGVVLERIDFTEQQRNFRVVGHRAGPCDGAGICASRGRARGRGRHNQYSVQAHRALNRGKGTRLNQIGAGLEAGPTQRRRSSRRYR